jgi:DNA-binding LytR/AlgR family response regulator
VPDVIQIGVVDDDAASREVVAAHLRRFQDEHPVQLAVRTYRDGRDLVRSYRSDLDVLFLDVEMAEMGGFETARAIREVDQRVVIVFVTRLGQLAVRGYEVDALSYLVKPVGYFAFAQQLARCVTRVRRLGCDAIMLPTARGAARVEVADIVHVASQKHRMVVHALDGQYAFTGVLKTLEAELSARGFFRCSNSFLVNLRHVQAVHRASCIVLGGAEIPVSRARKRAFLDALVDHVGGWAW